jgi:hypothetical protein
VVSQRLFHASLATKLNHRPRQPVYPSSAYTFTKTSRSIELALRHEVLLIRVADEIGKSR